MMTLSRSESVCQRERLLSRAVWTDSRGSLYVGDNREADSMTFGDNVAFVVAPGLASLAGRVGQLNQPSHLCARRPT